MTSPAVEITNYLNSQIAGLTTGSNLFVGSEPTTPADVVTVYDTGGYSPDQTLAGNMFGRRPTVQIRIRNAAYVAGNTQAETIRDTLESVVHQALGSDYYGIFTVSDIVHLGKITTNAGLAHVWSYNIQIIKEE
jgi:hypothetical protein